MPKSAPKRRDRGSIERRGNSFRVKVYAGLDPLTGRRLYLTDSTTDEREAERIRTRLQADRQHPEPLLTFNDDIQGTAAVVAAAMAGAAGASGVRLAD